MTFASIWTNGTRVTQGKEAGRDKDAQSSFFFSTKLEKNDGKEKEGENRGASVMNTSLWMYYTFILNSTCAV